MRSKRTFSVRAASLGGALALLGAGLAGTVGLVATTAVTATPAGADTAPFTATCVLKVAGSTVDESISGLVVTGSLSPTVPAAGAKFTLSNFAELFTLGQPGQRDQGRHPLGNREGDGDGHRRNAGQPGRYVHHSLDGDRGQPAADQGPRIGGEFHQWHRVARPVGLDLHEQHLDV